MVGKLKGEGEIRNIFQSTNYRGDVAIQIEICLKIRIEFGSNLEGIIS